MSYARQLLLAPSNHTRQISLFILSSTKLRTKLYDFLPESGLIRCIYRPSHKVKPELQSILSRLHVLIVGPGLGREAYMQSYAKIAVSMAKEREMYIVLDADGLYMIGEDISIIIGYRRAVLTPNIVEFKRLSEQVGIDPKIPNDQRAALVSKSLGGVTVLQKGAKDVISSDTTGDEADLRESRMGGAGVEIEKVQETVEVDIEGGLKRCGGQGDVLSGCVGTFMAWGRCYEDGAFG